MTLRNPTFLLMALLIPAPVLAGASGHWEYPPTYNAHYCPSASSIPPGGTITFRAKADTCSCPTPAYDLDTYYDIYNRPAEPPIPQSRYDDTFAVTWLVNGVEVGAGTEYEWTAPCASGTYYVSWTLSNSRIVGDPRKDPSATTYLGSVTVAALPTVTNAVPACDGEYVADDPNTQEIEPRIKAYVSVPAGDAISSVSLWVDGSYKDELTQEGDHWIYRWNTSGTADSLPLHTITVKALNSHSCPGEASRQVYVHPHVWPDQISYGSTDDSDHRWPLWNREDGDEEITPPHWDATDGLATKPFAYTAGNAVVARVRLVSDVDPPLPPTYLKYNVSGSWKNSAATEIDSYGTSVASPNLVSLPYTLVHSTTAPNLVMDYSLDQSYDFYIRKCSDSDWCWAGSTNATHPQVYLTFGQPIGPWGTSANNGPRTCWSSVISDACQWIPEEGYSNSSNGQLSARKRLAQKAYNSTGVVYDGGQSHLINADRKFLLHSFMNQNDPKADCRDMSAWWAKLCESLGLDGRMRKIRGYVGTYGFGYWTGFNTKDIKPIGTGWTTTYWSYHQVGFLSATGDSHVFDACLMLKPSDAYVPADQPFYGSYIPDLWHQYQPQQPYWYDPDYALLEVE